MQKKKFYNFIQKYTIYSIEQHLVYLFVNNLSIQYKKSEIISDLLSFKIDKNIIDDLSILNIYDIKILESYIEILIPQNDKKLNGAFFTPKKIVDFIIDEVSPSIDDKCLDPSCGCGAFLIGLVEFYRKNYNKSIKSIIKENIYGFDILDYNIKRSKTILSLYALLNNEILEEEDFNIFCKNSLTDKIDIKFNIVVGNPPYVKFQDIDEKNREFLLSNYLTTKKGTFNTYFAFFELGYKLLTKNGKMGFITPNNYFTSLAGLPLREYFLNNKSIYKIIDFKDIKIFDAQTYTALTFINQDENNEILFERIGKKQKYMDFLETLNFSKNYIDNLNSKKWRLLKNDEQNNIKIIENIGTPIKELFDISVGIATLKDEVYFIDGATLDNGFYKKEIENITYYIEQEITKSVYKISKFKNQDEIKNNKLKIITPYKILDNQAIPIAENEFKIKYPKCYQYLISQKEILSKRDKGKKPVNPFYLWGRTQGIAKKGKKIVNPTFSKNPRFLFVSKEDSYYTNGYGIYFNKEKNSNNTLFSEFIHPLSQEKNILLVQKILNSVIMDYYISATSISIQGGFPCYQKNFIEKFTIPNLTDNEIEILDNLSDKKDIDNFLIDKYQVKLDIPNLVS